jgi:uncharacterized protein (TIGR03000 family)
MLPVRYFASGAFGVALATLLFAAEPVLAQRGGGHGGGGGSRGGGGGGSRGFSSAGGGRSFAGPSVGRSFSPSFGRPVSTGQFHNSFDHRHSFEHRRFDRNFFFFGYGFGYPGYFGLYDNPWLFAGYNSGYAGGYYVPDSYLPDSYSVPSLDQPAYPYPEPGYAPGLGQDDSVHLRVKLPVADAQLWVEGQVTSQTGAERDFDSPALTAGKPFLYEMRAQWTENGRGVVQTRRIVVRAGQHLLVDFTQPPSPEKLTMPRVAD